MTLPFLAELYHWPAERILFLKLFLFYVYGVLLAHVSVHHMYEMPAEARGRNQIPRAGSYRWL